MKLDLLEDIMKARRAKGLANWKKLEHLQDKLEGKQASHITYTTSYPGQEGSKKHLGSATGNLYFLLGYVNPGFHVAPYHWQLVDPNMTDEEAASKDHPANPRYWKEAGLEIIDEGDFDAGQPHKMAKSDRKARARTSERKKDAITVQSGYGRYVGVPGEGHIYSLQNGHVYKWDIVKESYLAATNEDLAEKMNEEYDEGFGDEEYVKSLSRRTPFDDSVYPLVSRTFPRPGSVFQVEDLRVLVKSDRLAFYDDQGNPALVEIFDRRYHSFDLTKGGDIHPHFLLQFAAKYFNVDKEDLEQFVHKSQPFDEGITKKEAKRAVESTRLDLSDEEFGLAEVVEGMNIEREHGDVTKTGKGLLKIALAHLREDPKYYAKLRKVES